MSAPLLPIWGISLKLVPQDQFTPKPFDDSQCNLHQHEAHRPKVVVFFVHGLGGGGYKTWGSFPKYVFESEVGTDAVVYNYVSSYKRWYHWTGISVYKHINRIAQTINQLEKDGYEHIFLIGHSLGGVLAEAAAEQYVSQYVTAHGLCPLAGIFVMGAPRGGAALAWVPGARMLLPDLRILRSTSPDLARVDKFFQGRRVQESLLGLLADEQLLLPRFACVADRDALVYELSAGLSIPVDQRKNVIAGHLRLVKPATPAHEQVTWLLEQLQACLEARAQRRREGQHSQGRLNPPNSGTSTVLFSEFRSSSDGTAWAEAYLDALDSLTDPDVVVRDVSGTSRNASIGRPTLVVSASSADAVLQNRTIERRQHSDAWRRASTTAETTVGISPVGTASTEACGVLHDWFSAEMPPRGTVYIEGAQDSSDLFAVISRWLLLLVRRWRTNPETGWTDDEGVGT
jgi:pimeloyl-ACP methyl ester carboxylesterase